MSEFALPLAGLLETDGRRLLLLCSLMHGGLQLLLVVIEQSLQLLGLLDFLVEAGRKLIVPRDQGLELLLSLVQSRSEGLHIFHRDAQAAVHAHRTILGRGAPLSSIRHVRPVRGLAAVTAVPAPLLPDDRLSFSRAEGLARRPHQVFRQRLLQLINKCLQLLVLAREFGLVARRSIGVLLLLDVIQEGILFFGQRREPLVEPLQFDRLIWKVMAQDRLRLAHRAVRASQLRCGVRVKPRHVDAKRRRPHSDILRRFGALGAGKLRLQSGNLRLQPLILL